MLERGEYRVSYHDNNEACCDGENNAGFASNARHAGPSGVKLFARTCGAEVVRRVKAVVALAVGSAVAFGGAWGAGGSRDSLAIAAEALVA